MADVLPFRLVEDTYFLISDEETEQMRDWILAVVGGSETSASAAQLITNWIVEEANTDSESVVKYRNKSIAGQGGNDDEDEFKHRRPQPALCRELVILQAGSAAASLPPHDVGHNRLINLFHNFAAFPPKKVPSCTTTDATGLSNRENVWGTSDHTQDMGQQFYELADCNGKSTYNGIDSGIDQPGSTEQQRWRNLQSFLARLCSDDSGLWDCSMYCALFELERELHFSQREKARSKELRAGHAIAAAQWIVPAGIGEWVYAQCRMRAMPSGDDRKRRPWHDMWTMESWKVWLKAFEEVADGEGNDAAARETAGRAAARMKGIEGEQS